MDIWQFIEEKLNHNLNLYLMCVMQHQGSSPGRQGFKMAVASDGAIHGSIGGGVMEFNLVELCKKMLASNDLKPMVKHQIHKGKIVDGSGMICSGEQTVIFYPLQIDQLFTISQIIQTLSEGKSGLLGFNPKEFSFHNQESAIQFRFSHQDEVSWDYQELLNYKDQVYIVGGGHVGLATSKLLRELGFYVVVFDNRENLNTFEANTYAHQKHLIDYTEAANHIPKKDAFIAIMTNKYTDDKLVLSQLIRRSNKFVGVLGSKAKLELMFEVLEKEGFSKGELAHIKAPIGLKISSQTPKEIAVSIAAQLIDVRRNLA